MSHENTNRPGASNQSTPETGSAGPGLSEPAQKEPSGAGQIVGFFILLAIIALTIWGMVAYARAASGPMQFKYDCTISQAEGLTRTHYNGRSSSTHHYLQIRTYCDDSRHQREFLLPEKYIGKIFTGDAVDLKIQYRNMGMPLIEAVNIREATTDEAKAVAHDREEKIIRP